jgi:hypothetical protein
VELTQWRPENKGRRRRTSDTWTTTPSDCRSRPPRNSPRSLVSASRCPRHGWGRAMAAVRRACLGLLPPSYADVERDESRLNALRTTSANFASAKGASSLWLEVEKNGRSRQWQQCEEGESLILRFNGCCSMRSGRVNKVQHTRVAFMMARGGRRTNFRGPGFSRWEAELYICRRPP